MNFNNGTDTVNGLSRMNSASSTAPLTPGNYFRGTELLTKKPLEDS